MADSRRLATIIGPAMIVIAVTEWRNMDIFAQQTAPVVYLNGTILFVAGLALLRAHNRWTLGWPTLITLVGWVLLLGGLYRMWAPAAPQIHVGMWADVVFVVIALVGLILTYQSHKRSFRCSQN